MRRILAITAAIAAITLSGCAHTEYYQALAQAMEQQGKVDVEREKTRQAEAAARSARAEAIKIGMGKNDIAATVGVAMLAGADIVKESGGGRGDAKTDAPSPIVTALLSHPPEDAFDKGLRLLTGIGSVTGNFAATLSPFLLARESGKTQRYLADSNVQLEAARQSGETSRITVIANTGSATATALANRPATNTTTTTNTFSGNRDVSNGGSTLTHDEHNTDDHGTSTTTTNPPPAGSGTP